MRGKRKLKKVKPEPEFKMACGKNYEHPCHMYYDAHDYAQPCDGVTYTAVS